MGDVFPTLVVARWFHFVSIFILFGSSFFWFYMDNGLPAARRATVILLRVAAPVAAISGLVWLAGILANMTNGFASVLDPDTLHVFFFETQFGGVAILRLMLMAAAVLIAFLPSGGQTWFSALLHVGALLLINQAWLGHAAEGGAGLLGVTMIFVYSLHVLAAGAWVGGLPPLAFALAELRGLGPDETREKTYHVLSRYSLMAMVAVAMIVITGVTNADFRTGFDLEKLFNTDYGNVLFTKAGLVTAMLALAFFNRFIAMPRLRAASPESNALAAKLRVSLNVELVLGALVLGAAAVLGITPPPQ